MRAGLQGGALALLALRYSMKLAGVLALSTYLPMVSSPPLVSKQNIPTPVLMCHGTKDTTVRSLPPTITPTHRHT